MHHALHKIENVFVGLPNYNCFACSPHHDEGLRLAFSHDPAENCVVCPIEPVKESFAGFPTILHGGFQAMILDEAMFWAACHFERKVTFSSEFEMHFLRSVRTGKPLLAKARILRSIRGKVFEAEAWLEMEGEIVARATGRYMTVKRADLEALAGTTAIPEKLAAMLG
jgi:acyl-coenzyme A thioesterase PaaI-like protein